MDTDEFDAFEDRHAIDDIDEDFHYDDDYYYAIDDIDEDYADERDYQSYIDDYYA